MEVPEAGTETETVTANPDGTVTTAVSQTPVRIPNGQGGWEPVDLSLQPESGAGSDLAPAASAQTLSVSGDGTGALASVDTPGAGSVGLDFDGPLGSPSVQGDQATYPVQGTGDASSDAVEVRATDTGFAAHVLIARAPAAGTTEAPVYRFPIVAPGMSVALDGGRLTFRNGDGTVVAESAPLMMWDARTDAAGDPSHVVPVDAQLVPGSSGMVLELHPSLAFLQAADTEFPVTVDPDISATRVTDTWLNESQPSTSFVNSYSVRVGSPDGLTTTRTMEQFQIDRVYGQAVTSATLKLYQYSAGTCTALKTWAYSVNDPTTWSTSMTWNNQPAVRDDVRFNTSTSFNHGVPNSCGDDYASLDVTPIVASYAEGKFPSARTLGDGTSHNVAEIELRANREYNALDEKRFCSMNAQLAVSGHACNPTDTTLPSRKPELLITSVPDLGVAPWYSMTDHKLNDRSTLSVNNDNGNAVLKADDVSIKGLGQDLNISRYYNSQADPATPNSMGPHWSMSVGPDVWFERLNQYSFMYHSPGGRVFGPYFRNSADSTTAAYDNFERPLGAPGANLVDTNATGQMTFEMTMHTSQKKYTFKDIDTTAGNDNLYLTSTTDRSGNTITYNYAAGTHQLTSITDTEQRTIGIGYTGGVITSITDPTNRTWTYGYTNGRLSSYTDPEGKTVDYGYTTTGTTGGDSWIGTITDPVNDSGARPQATIAYGSGQAIGVRYAASTTDTTSVGYDLNYSVTTQGLSTRCVAGDDTSTDVFSTDTTKGRTTYCFRQRSANETTQRMTHTVVDGNGDKTSQNYSADQQPVTFTSGNSNNGTTSGSTVATYGGAGFEDRLSKITDPVDAGSATGSSTGYSYNTPSTKKGADYLPSSKVDANGDCTAYVYDPTGRLTDSYIELTPSGGNCDGQTGGKHYSQSYNTDGTLAWRQDPDAGAGNARTVFTYWHAGQAGFVTGTEGQLKTMQRPGGSCASPVKLCTSYTYDSLGRIATMTDGRGKVTSYTYDKLDRTKTVTVNGASSCQVALGTCVSYTYDAEGNMTSRQDALGTTTWTYDRLNRQRSETATDTTTIPATSTAVGYDYNDDGKLTRLTQSNGGQVVDTVAYTYDTANKPLAVIGNPDAAATSQLRIDLDQDHDGRPNYTQFPTTPTKVTVARTVTNAGRPKTITVRNTDGTGTLADTTFSYVQGTTDTNHLQQVAVTGSSNAAINSTINYGYTHNKLTSSTRDGGTQRNYTYDNAGNLTKEETPNGTFYYGYDRAGELCWKGNTSGTAAQQLADTCTSGNTPTGDTTVTQDAAGNSTGTTADPYTYNDYNQVASIDGQNQAYRDLGNNLRVHIGSTTQVNSSLGVISRTTTNGVTTTTTYYLRAPDGTILASHDAQSGSTYRSSAIYYVTDQQGSVTMLIDATGARVGYYRYSPWGDPTVLDNVNNAATTNPWRYLGAYYDNPTGTTGGGYTHLQARYYDNHGHFTQPDARPGSLGDPTSTLAYGYAGGDPINHADPSGQFWGVDWGAVVEWDGWDEVGTYALGGGIGVAGTLGGGALAAAAYLDYAVGGGDALLAIAGVAGGLEIIAVSLLSSAFILGTASPAE